MIRMRSNHILQQTELFEMHTWAVLLAFGLKGIRCGTASGDFDDFHFYI